MPTLSTITCNWPHSFNHQFYYGDASVEGNDETNDGLLKCSEKLSATTEEEDEATAELAYYKRSEGLFSLKTAIRNRTTIAPGWLKCFVSIL